MVYISHELDNFNPFLLNVSFLYALKMSENSNVFEEGVIEKEHWYEMG